MSFLAKNKMCGFPRIRMAVAFTLHMSSSKEASLMYRPRRSFDVASMLKQFLKHADLIKSH